MKISTIGYENIGIVTGMCFADFDCDVVSCDTVEGKKNSSHWSEMLIYGLPFDDMFWEKWRYFVTISYLTAVAIHFMNGWEEFEGFNYGRMAFVDRWEMDATSQAVYAYEEVC